MGPAGGIVLSLAYVLGLVAAIVPWGGLVLLVAGIGCGFGVPRKWRSGPSRRLWFMAGAVGLVASLYLQLRQPQPGTDDISRFIPPADLPAAQAIVVVEGRVETVPRITRSQKARFWLQVTQLYGAESKTSQLGAGEARGRLYVTVPLLQATGLRPGQRVDILGKLSKPMPATNPGAFDFQEYLAQQGSFASFRGERLETLEPEQTPRWGLWWVQQRILQSQTSSLGSPEGPLVSSMVLGSRAVDLPYDIQDQFRRVGLAHALAASGFQTSLILGVVLALTRRFSGKVQFTIGTLCLGLFVGLAGLQPAVLRAAVMGMGALVALVMKRKTKPLGSLLLAAVFLLLMNPLWIWDLGFQLSFLATMGLMVTVQPLTQRLDWLPSAIAPLLAVPIAAYAWTLPLQLYAFGVVSPYSIPVNVLTTPLISLLSLGGIVSALAAVCWFPAGSALAWLLDYPTQLLVGLVEAANQWWGNSYATGTIPLITLVVLYGLIGLAWLQPWWQRRWWVALILGVALVLVPTGYARATMLQVTVLATQGEPVMVVQDGGRTGVINSGDARTVNFTLLPFLQKEGVNEVDWAIASDPPDPIREGWEAILQQLPIRYFYETRSDGKEKQFQAFREKVRQSGAYLTPLQGQSTERRSVFWKSLPVLQSPLEFQIKGQHWLLLPNLSPKQQSLLAKSPLPDVDVLWWTGKSLNGELLTRLQPEVAIASAPFMNPKTVEYFSKQKIRLYWTGRDGAVQWTPQIGFKTILDADDTPAL